MQEISSFDEFAPYYDQFRFSCPIFCKGELPLIVKHIKRVLRLLCRQTNCKEVRLVDVGAGTGMWSEKVITVGKRMGLPVSGCAIDNSSAMANVARQRLQESRVEVICADFPSLVPRIGAPQFNLALVGLSADYIGIATVEKALRTLVRPGGFVLLWLYDHSRYDFGGNEVNKLWLFEDKRIQLKANRTLVADVHRTFLEAEWRTVTFLHRLPFIGGVERRLAVFLAQHQAYPNSSGAPGSRKSVAVRDVEQSRYG